MSSVLQKSMGLSLGSFEYLFASISEILQLEDFEFTYQPSNGIGF